MNMYSCSCMDGYTGMNCQTDIDECSSNPCQNGGTCEDSCSCTDGYTGMNCPIGIDECGSMNVILIHVRMVALVRTK